MGGWEEGWEWSWQSFPKPGPLLLPKRADSGDLYSLSHPHNRGASDELPEKLPKASPASPATPLQLPKCARGEQPQNHRQVWVIVL